MRTQLRTFVSRAIALGIVLPCALTEAATLPASTLDINGDGHPDISLGTSVNPGKGHASIYLGTPSGLSVHPAQDIKGPDGPHWGNAVRNIGDINGDGYSDVAYGASYANKAYVYLGGPNGLSLEPQVTLVCPDGTIGGFGRALAAPGDVNGDGYPDLVVGSFGAVFLYAGGPDGMGASPISDLRSPLSPDGSYLRDDHGRVAEAGDVNQDGFADIVVSAGQSGQGRVYLYYGGAQGFTSPGEEIPMPPGAWRFGETLCSADDYNQDGLPDLLIAAPRTVVFNPGGTTRNIGSVYVYYGTPGGISTTPFQLPAPGPEWGFGATLSSIGDFNGDGYPDVFITSTADNFNTKDQRKGYLFTGGPTGLSSTPFASVQLFADFLFPAEVQGIGDHNGDGFADIALGESPAKVVAVFNGKPAASVLVPDFTILMPSTTSDGAPEGFGMPILGYNPQASRGRPRNVPPIPNAGPDRTVSAGAHCQAAVVLDASASQDADNDSLTYTWSGSFGSAQGVNATVQLPLGSHQITLRVDDGRGGTAEDSLTVTVSDTTPPTITCPANITIPCGTDLLAPVAFPAPAVHDNCDAAPVLLCSRESGAMFPVGTTVVRCTATDASGNKSEYSFTVTRAALEFSGFLAPIGGADATGGSFATPARTFKANSTIPVKFTASCSGTPVTTGVHRLQAVKYSNETTAGEPIDATPQDAASSGNEFRLADGQWHFNLDTKSTGMSTGIWQLIATLSDGSEHRVWIQIK